MFPIYLSPTLDEGPGSKFIGTNLDSFEANWILELDPRLYPSLHLGSPNSELSLKLFSFSLVWTNWFSLQNGICRFSLDLPLFGLGPSSKGCGSNLWLPTNRIALFHWTLDLQPSSKVAFSMNFFKKSEPPHLWFKIFERSNAYVTRKGGSPKYACAMTSKENSSMEFSVHQHCKIRTHNWPNLNTLLTQ